MSVVECVDEANKVNPDVGLALLVSSQETDCSDYNSISPISSQEDEEEVQYGVERVDDLSEED